MRHFWPMIGSGRLNKAKVASKLPARCAHACFTSVTLLGRGTSNVQTQTVMGLPRGAELAAQALLQMHSGLRHTQVISLSTSSSSKALS